MNSRRLDFITGIEASAQPDAGDPTNPNDVLTKSYADTNFKRRPTLSGSTGVPTSIVAVTGIVFAAVTGVWEYLYFITGATAALDISANPQISAGTLVGQRLTLRGCSDVNTVQLEDGNGLKLNGLCILADGSELELVWNGTVWEEVSRNMI